MEEGGGERRKVRKGEGMACLPGLEESGRNGQEMTQLLRVSVNPYHLLGGNTVCDIASRSGRCGFSSQDNFLKRKLP
ncbi:hypothetical protein E2C01_051420 [Portunus trituberculatus]|uniref:Uncharacterized protein n=1 Tax=Portunus trituberculatus TaxID=210409 RepID=A0A5B7GAX7_PORTR|nr:hypothetical protein [Portunus trituberculatus]